MWLLGVFVLMGLWTSLYTLLIAKQFMLELHWESLANNVLFVLVWVLLIPTVWTLERRLQFSRLGWLRWLVWHVGVSLGYAFLQSVLAMVLARIWMVQVHPEQPLDLKRFIPMIWQSILTMPLSAWMLFWLTLLGFYGVETYRRWREEELTSARLANQLTEARLQALQMQLQPHFLFNTLQTIAALVHRDADAAERMLALLGDMLRMVLDYSDEPLVPLSQELELTKHYLDIQQIRFGQRLQITWGVSPVALSLEVPTLILQPLIENAIKHGLESRPQGQLTIGANRERDKLYLSVIDNGQGSVHNGFRKRHGLSNIAERLKSLYGSAGTLQLNGTEKGVEALIVIPAVTSLVQQHGSGVEVHETM